MKKEELNLMEMEFCKYLNCEHCWPYQHIIDYAKKKGLWTQIHYDYDHYYECYKKEEEKIDIIWPTVKGLGESFV